ERADAEQQGTWTGEEAQPAHGTRPYPSPRDDLDASPEAGLVSHVAIATRLRGLRRRLSSQRDQAIAVKLSAIEKDLGKLRRQLWGAEDVRFVVDYANFEVIVKTVFAHGRTMLGRDRLWILWQAARNVAADTTAAAEVGAYRGGSAYFIASSFALLLG